MSKCEACGGDGLIEVGAYRGDESDTTTRECRLCGGVVTVAGRTFSREPLPKSVEQSLGVSSVKIVNGLIQAAVKTRSGFRELASDIQRTVSVEDPQNWAKRHADECDERLRRENERRQAEAESTAHVDEYYRKAKLGIVP